jgi:hypothetical protein
MIQDFLVEIFSIHEELDGGGELHQSGTGLALELFCHPGLDNFPYIYFTM